MANVIEFSIKAVDEFSSTMKKVSDSMDSVAGRFALAGTAVAGVAVAFNKFVDSSLEQAEAMAINAKKVDLTTDAYQRLNAAATLANASEGSLSTAMRTLSQSMFDAADPLNEQGMLLRELGITATEPKLALEQLADVMSGATGSAGKLAIGQKLLGRGFQELLPMLQGGSESMREVGEQAERLGLIMDGDLAAAADNARDNAELLGKALGAIKTNAVLPLAPALEETSGKWVKFAEHSQAAKAATIALNSALTGVMKLLAAFGDLALTVAELVGASFHVLGSVIGGIGAAFVAAMSGNFKMAGDIIKETFADAGNTVAESKRALAAIWTEASATIVTATKNEGRNLDEVAKKIEAQKAAAKEAAEAAKEAARQKKEVAAAALRSEKEAAEVTKKLVDADIARMEARAAAINANLGPMQAFAHAQGIINGQVEQGIMTQEVANQKLWEADIAMKLAMASTAALTASNATAMESFQMMAVAQLESMGSVSAQVGEMMLGAMNTFVGGMANAVATAIVMGTSLSDLMKRVLQQVAIQVISTLIQIGIQRFILAGIYQAMNIKDAASSLSTGAAKVYMNSFASAAAIPVVGWAMAPGVAAANTALAMGGAATAGAAGVGLGMGIGAAHGGLGYVPEESTYLLQQGERVLSPRQNRDLTGFMESGGGGGGGSIGVVNIHILENATNADAFAKMNRVELRQALGQPIVDALNEMFRVGVKPDFATVAG